MLAAASVVVQIPFVGRGISYFDEGSILAIADRLRQGEVLYADRATFVAPLTYEVMRGLFTVFGPSMLVARLFMVAVFSVCAVLVYDILRSMIGRRTAVAGAIAFLALKPLGFPAWTMVNYSQVGMMFCLTAMALVSRYLADRRPRWLWLAALTVGITIVTKQNLGALIGFTAAATIAGDAVHRRRALSEAIGALTTLVLAAIPVLVAAAYYGAKGTLGVMVDRTVFQLPSVIAQYGPIPIPGFDVWSAHPDTFQIALFPYFPSPIWQIVLDEHWVLSRMPTALVVEGLVRAVYYAPLVAMAWAAVTLWRKARGNETRPASWSRLLMVTIFAAASYASMQYRADWTHLMNIFPALLLLCVVTLATARLPRRARVSLGVVALAVWLAGAVLVTGVILAFYSEPVETPRGRLLATRYQSDDTARILAHVARVPATTRLAFLHYDPLYYFLAGREIPLAFDIVHPGYFASGDDEATAAELRRVDEVVYNPKIVPTIATPFTDYAPRTAHVLAHEFAVTEIVAPSAYVLRRVSPPPPTESVVVDLWDAFDTLRPEARAGASGAAPEPGPQGMIARDNWLGYRVVRAAITRHEAPTCFSTRRAIGVDERIVAVPLPDPRLWRGAERDAVWAGADPSVRTVRFEITVARVGAEPVVVRSEERPIDWPGAPLVAPLAAFTGATVDIRFCASAMSDGRNGATHVPVGWAEPRIVRPSA